MRNLGGDHRFLPRRTSVARDLQSTPPLRSAPCSCQGKIPTIDVCSRNRTAQMGQVQVQSREHNTQCFVLRNIRLEGARSNQQLNLSLRCPLSLMPLSGHHDRPSWQAFLSIETAPRTNKNGPITGPMKRPTNRRIYCYLLSCRSCRSSQITCLKTRVLYSRTQNIRIGQSKLHGRILMLCLAEPSFFKPPRTSPRRHVGKPKCDSYRDTLTRQTPSGRLPPLTLCRILQQVC